MIQGSVNVDPLKEGNMKARTIIALLVAGIVIGALAAYFILGPGLGKTTGKETVPSTGPFSAVTSQLDPGGTMYLFWDTAGLVKFCEKALDGIQSTLEKQPASETARENNLKWFQLVRRMIGETGLYRVKALGASSIPLDETMHRTRMVLYRAPETSTDLIWNLYAPAPHALPELGLLPADTALAQFGDFRPRVLWDWIHTQAEKSGVEEFKKGVSVLAPALKMQGIEPDTILNGFNGSAGLVITLDKERTIQVPMGNTTTPIPAPNLALVMAVKDFSLYDLVAGGIQPGKKADTAEAVRFLPLPAPPNPIFSSPTLACNGSYLVFASAKELAETLMDGTGGLKNSAAFKELARDMPATGNGFRYISPRLGEVIRGIQDHALKNPQLKDNDRQALQTLMNLVPTDFSMYGVVEHDSTGFRYTLNHRLGLHYLVVLPAVMAAGIGAAVAMPAMVKSTKMARRAKTLAQMRSISAQVLAYLAEHGATPETIEIVKDGWGNPILYRRGPGITDFALGSGGADGRFEGWEQRGVYSGDDPGNKDRDLVMVNGDLVYGPVK